MKHLLRLTCVIVCLAVSVSDLSAALIEVGSPMGIMSLDSNSVGTVTPTGPNSFVWMGAMSNSTLGWEIDWNLIIDEDPKITGVTAFTNLFPAITNFTFNISANSAISIPSPTVNGASTISVLDTDADGALMNAQTGGSIYDAFIAASSQQTLFNDPFSLVAPPQGVNQTGTAWGPQASTVALNLGDAFGINHAFALSGLDQATVNSSFFIVPEPTTLGIVALGGMMLLHRKRRA
ncbi:MAG: PEP-CTERM sorting domain-containing protein [Phycisphaerae bacterium]